MDIENSKNTQNDDNQNNDTTIEKRAEFSDFVSPYLEPIYGLFVDDFITKYKIKLTSTFWFVFTLFVFSVLTLYFNLSYQGAFFLFLLALLIFLTQNRKLITNIVTTKILYNKSKIVDEFIKNIDSKNLDETKRFIINNYHELNTQDLILILQSKFCEYSAFHTSILKNQIITSELLEYIIKNDFIPKLGDDIFCEYLKFSSNPISLSSYEIIKNKYRDNPKIIKTLHVCCPSYMKSHSIFKFFANIRLGLKESLNYGKIKYFLSILWFFVIIYAISINPIPSSSFIIPNTSDQSTKTLFTLLNFVNFSLSLLLTVGIFVIITLFVIVWILRRYRTLLYLVAPSSAE